MQHVSDAECLSLLWEGENGPCGAASLNALDALMYSAGSSAAKRSSKPTCGPALEDLELRSTVSLTAPPHPHLGLLESYGGQTAPPPHEVRVVQVLASPRVRLLHDFVTAAEAAEILRLSESHFHRSPVRSVAQDRRTSYLI